MRGAELFAHGGIKRKPNNRVELRGFHQVSEERQGGGGLASGLGWVGNSKGASVGREQKYVVCVEAGKEGKMRGWKLSCRGGPNCHDFSVTSSAEHLVWFATRLRLPFDF